MKIFIYLGLLMWIFILSPIMIALSFLWIFGKIISIIEKDNDYISLIQFNKEIIGGGFINNNN